MNKRKNIISAVMAVSALTAAVSCSSKVTSSHEESNRYKKTDEISVSADADNIEEENAVRNIDISGQTITWLADYDLNPQNDREQSAALSLFEDVYGAKVNFVPTTSEEKLTQLAYMIIAGEEVDMFPYEPDAVPNGVVRGMYQPLDPYFDVMGMDEGIWDDMNGVIEMFQYNGEHYVVPYAVTDPLIITYSRKMIKDEKLDDPYKLYLDGKWNWDKCMKMMEKFVSGASGGQTRYGINGWFGQAALQSTGHTVVNYDGEKFSNNIDDPEIEKAELFLQKIAKKNLYNPEWTGCFPNNGSTLFYAMGSWALGASNAENEDADLMVVPFPKSPDADKNYISCNFSARMLVKNSQKGEAVAAYIKCERLTAIQEEYKEIAKKNALKVEKSSSGLKKSFVTEEQYDAVQSFLDPENSVPVFDFGYGMGDKMHGDGDYTFETRGVMDNLTTVMLEGGGSVNSWDSLRDAVTDIIDSEVKEFNRGR